MVPDTSLQAGTEARFQQLPDAQQRMIENTLFALTQVDQDALAVYDAALDKIHDPDIRGKVAAFREDHARHVDEIANLFRGKGVAIPTRAPSPLAVLRSGEIRDAANETDALVMLLAFEALSEAKHGEIARNGDILPPSAVDIGRDGLRDEIRHFDGVAEELANRGQARDLGGFKTLHMALADMVGARG